MLSRKRPSRRIAKLQRDRRRSLQRGIEQLEARLPLAGTSPDTFVLQPNSISYESDAVFYSQTIGEPTVDVDTGQTTIDLRANDAGDQVVALTTGLVSDVNQSLLNQTVPADVDRILVDPSQTYRLDSTTLDHREQIVFHLRYTAYDRDGQQISPAHVNQYPGSTDTILLNVIQPGDLSILVADASGWSNDFGQPARTRALSWFGFQDAAGTTYENYTYTRNVLGDESEPAWSAGAIELDSAAGGYRITLAKPWAGPAVAQGTAVRNALGEHGQFEIPVHRYNSAFVEYVSTDSEFLGQVIDISTTFGGSPWQSNTTVQQSLPPAVDSIEFRPTLPLIRATVGFDGEETVDNAVIATFQGDTRFVASGSLQPVQSDTAYAIDTSDTYELSAFGSVHLPPGGTTTNETHSIGFTAQDADGLPIKSEHVTRFESSVDTLLAVALSPGDTQIVLDDAAGWSNIDTDPNTRSLAWYGYTDSFGTTYDDYTYTRNVKSDPVNGLWSVQGINGNTITLNQPWDGPAIAVGTAVRNAVSGEWLTPALLENSSLSVAGQRFTTTLSGVWQNGIPTTTAFPPGTASIRAAARFNQSNLVENDIAVLESFAISQSPLQTVAVDPVTKTYSVKLDVLANDEAAIGNVRLIDVTAQVGNASVQSGIIEYESVGWFIGTDQLTYTFLDLDTGQEWTESATVTIRGTNVAQDPALQASLDSNATNTAVARPPIGNDDTGSILGYRVVSGQTLNADGIKQANLFSNDGYRERRTLPATVALVEGPANGSLILNQDSTFQYTPVDGFVGTDTFKYEIFDGLRTDTAIATINVYESSLDFVDRNLYSLALAAHNFHSVYQSLPPSSSIHRDANGVPFLSWRVHLLPYLGYFELYDQFNLEEPWDSENNLPLAAMMPDVFRDGIDTDIFTRIQAITSPSGSMHEGYGFIGHSSDGDIRFREILDGLSNTLLYVQVGSDRAVLWTAPLDANFDFDDPLNTLGTIDSRGIPAVFFDGRTALLPADIDVDTFGHFASRSGPATGNEYDSDTYFRRLASDSGGQSAIEIYDGGGQRQDLYSKEIGGVFLNHHAFQGLLPPRTTSSTNWPGWRVSTLPLTEGHGIYLGYDDSQPWDSADNLQLLDEMPDYLRSFGDSPDSNTTRLRRLIGSGAAWETVDEELQLRDIVDGPRNTLLVVEGGPDQSITWLARDEVNFDPADPMAALGDVDGFFRGILADGSTIKLPADIDPEIFKALVTKDSRDFYGPNDVPAAEFVDADTLRRRYAPLNGFVDTEVNQQNRMKEISLAILNYHSAFRHLPFSSNENYFDENGNPFLSWRVHLLPFLDHDVLYEQFNLDEPWDSPNNLPLLEHMPDVFRSVGDSFDSTVTRIQRFVNDEDCPTAENRICAPFEDNNEGRYSFQVRLRDFLDGVSNTIAFVESGADAAVSWTKPLDVVFDRNDPMANLGDVGEYITVAMADGVITQVPSDDTVGLIALITPQARDTIEAFSDVDARRTVITEGEIGAFDFRYRKSPLGSEIDRLGTLPVTVADPDVLIVHPAEIVSTSENWDQFQSITFQAVDNAAVDGPRTTTITIGDQSIEVTIVDNDSFQFLTDADTATVDETGTTATRTVVLDAQPTSDVVVRVESLDEGEVVVDRTSVTFTPANWDQPQSILITGVGDSPLADQNTVSLVELTIDAVISDPLFANAQPLAIQVTNVDIDEAELIVDTTSLVLTEAADTENVLVALTAQPTSTVRVNLQISDPTQATVDTPQLVFTSANWDHPQTVIVAAVDDLILDGTAMVDLTVQVDAMSDGAFLDAETRTVVLVVNDNDAADLIITPATTLVINENGSSQDIMVSLSAAPLTPVAINAIGNRPLEATVAPAQIVFDSNNWNVAQSIAVTGVDDDVVDLDQSSIVTLSVDVSSDPGFLAIDNRTLDVITTDDESGEIVIDETGFVSTLSETGNKSSFKVALADKPLTPVRIELIVGDSSEVSSSHSNLTFTALDWNIPQSVELTGVDDVFVDGTQVSHVQLQVIAAESDPGFASASIQTLSITTTDNDLANFTVTESDGDTQVIEQGTGDSISVSLDAGPLTDVVLLVSSSDPNTATVSVSELVFTPQNWDVSQEVAVAAVDNDQADGERVFDITVSIDTTRSDSAFAAVLDSVVGGKALDNDVAGIQLVRAPAQVGELETETSFEVALTAQPTTSVKLNVGVEDDSELSTNVAPLIFDSTNWNEPQTIIVTGIDDEILDGDISSNIIVSVDTNASDEAFVTVDALDVPIVNIDNDTAAFVIKDADDVSVGEGDSAHDVSIVLESQPLSDVEIGIELPVDPDVTTSTTSIVFTPQNWNVEQSVTFSGIDDPFVDGDASTEIRFFVMENSEPSFLAALSHRIDVITTDDDVAGFDVIQTDATTTVIEDGDSDTVSVQLTGAPLSPVFIDVISPALQVSTSRLRFDGSNWDKPQEILVETDADGIVTGGRTESLQFAVDDEASDSAFNDLETGVVDVAITDIDLAGIKVTPDQQMVREGDSDDVTFDVSLPSAPLSDVTLEIVADRDDEITIDASTLVFTPDNWDVAQAIGISAIDDVIADGTKTTKVSIRVQQEASDQLFADVEPAVVDVLTEDDEVPAINLDGHSDLQLSEANGTATFTVSLTAQPQSAVQMTIPAVGVLVSPAEIVFDADSWDTPQTVMITGLPDLSSIDDLQTELQLQIADDSDAFFVSLVVDPVSVTVTDHAFDQIIVRQQDDRLVASEVGSDVEIASSSIGDQERLSLVLSERDEVIQIEVSEAAESLLTIETGDGDDRIETTRLPVATMIDGGSGYDQLVVAGVDSEVDFASALDGGFRSIEGLDFRGIGQNTGSVSAAGIARVFGDSAELTIMQDGADDLSWSDDWSAEAPTVDNGIWSHRLVGGNVALNLINQYSWTNPLSRFDVNRDGSISAIDALLVINHINRNGAEVNLPGIVLEYYVDVNGSGDSSALDALQVINRLDDDSRIVQASTAQSDTTGEGEQEGSLLQLSDFLKRQRDGDDPTDW